MSQERRSLLGGIDVSRSVNYEPGSYVSEHDLSSPWSSDTESTHSTASSDSYSRQTASFKDVDVDHGEKQPLLAGMATNVLGSLSSFSNLPTTGNTVEGASRALGKKTITFFGSFVLTVNNISGPGMLALPLVFQQAGIITPTLTLIFICVISSFASTMICEAMALVPGNHRFDERLEFATVVKHYFGTTAYVITQIFYNLSLQTMNIASILVTAQVMDEFLVYIFGQSYALQLWPSVDIVSAITEKSETIPFQDDGAIVLTLGYLVVAGCCMPMGFLNLDENVYFQYVSWIILVSLLGEFTWQYFDKGLDPSRTPWMGENQAEVIGVVIFAYTYVVTIPSWCNEKKDNVSVNKAIWSSTITCTIAYIAFGLLGAMAYPNQNGNLLSVMATPGASALTTQICVYIFSLGVIGLGIPLFSIVIRYNLFVGGVCSAPWSAFWGVVFPWLVGFLLYQGEGFTLFVNWSSLFVNGFINFVVPFIIYVKAKNVSVQFATKDYTANEDVGNYLMEEEIEDIVEEVHDGWHMHRALPKVVDDIQWVAISIPWVVMISVSTIIMLNIFMDLYLLIFQGVDVVDG